MEANLLSNLLFLSQTEIVGLPTLQKADQGPDAGTLHSRQLVAQPFVTVRAQDDRESRGRSVCVRSNPEDVFHNSSHSHELHEAIANAEDAEVQGCTLLDERNELLEVRAGMRAGEGDSNRMIQVLATDADGLHYLVDPS